MTGLEIKEEKIENLIYEIRGKQVRRCHACDCFKK